MGLVDHEDLGLRSLIDDCYSENEDPDAGTARVSGPTDEAIASKPLANKFLCFLVSGFENGSSFPLYFSSRIR